MWEVSQRELENLWNQVEKENEKIKKRVENERARERKREGGSGIRWKVKKKKKWEDGILWVYVCGGQNAREKKKKKKRKCIDKRKAKNKKSQFKNTITIFLQ